MNPAQCIPARILAAELDLEAAWVRVQEKSGMPGVDGIGARRFERCAPWMLREIETSLANEKYRCLPLRLAQIAKKNGGARVLLVPSVRDRVAQTAVAQWLSGRWNGNFHSCSFAYRPGLGVNDALLALAELREKGYRWVLDADIRSFFDSIEHSILFRLLTAKLGEASPAFLGWITQWVAGAVWTGSDLNRITCGVPQGSPLSPLLANCYLDGLDQSLSEAGIPFIRYADDFLLLARTPFDLSEARSVAEQALSGLGLFFNPDKTRTTSFERIFRFLGAEIRADGIFQPLRKKRVRCAPLYVAPIMPPALLRAWMAGVVEIATVFDHSSFQQIDEVKSASPECIETPGWCARCWTDRIRTGR